MDSMVVGPQKRRGRKRKRNDVNNVMVDSDGKKKVVETRSLKLVDRYVRKEFQESGVFLGKITSYDSGLYRVNYDDGDFEDLDSSEVKVFLIEDEDLIGEWSERKEKLDELLISKEVKAKVSKVENKVEQTNVSQVCLPLLSELSNGDADANEVGKVLDDGNNSADNDSLSDSCEDARQLDACIGTEVPPVPPPELPPSSGHIGVPEEYVSHLFSVHSFLRSFSVPLFLYPFGLDDFVGALNCSFTNTLLDSIHVALLGVLKRHLERISADGSELALKCLRFLDWSLLDTITWPVYLVHYLIAMGYTNGPHWKGFCTHTLDKDYYTLPAGMKLVILQILCDDVLDSEELRAEMDMREESEIGIDIETSTPVAPTGRPRRVHPRYNKSSTGKDTEEHSQMKTSQGKHFVGSQEGGTVGSSIDEDGNGDECRLCGMDGFLLCCDGCPSSYHTRCLGLNKMSMSAASWYCPECKINAIEPEIVRGTALKGGYYFGVDEYEQVFVATCDHLLLLKASINSENCLRYYNRHDIPRVLCALYSKAEHAVMYSEICRGIMQYWELPNNILPCYEPSEVCLQLEKEKESGESTTQLVKPLDKSVPEMTEVENTGSCVTGICAPEITASCLMDCIQGPIFCGNSLETVAVSDQAGNIDSTTQQSGYSMNTIMTEPTSSSGLPVNGTSLGVKMSIPSGEFNNGVDRKADESPYDGCLYMGSSFKINTYINQYVHGDFAASAAANLAVLSSEENQGHDSRSSGNRRKAMFASVSLQVKAFSSAALRFIWPHTEKKLVEVPRERCSWCFSCKAAVSSKRGCLLNLAASNATRGVAKVLAGARPMKNGDGRLPGISTYIMFMEESLSGLLVGPFLNETFRKRWRREAEQASTCNAIKILLLELEENIRTVALFGEWTKLVDASSTQSSASQIAANAAGSTQKRRPGRRGRKPSNVVEIPVDDSQDILTGFTWWRGGSLSKLMFHRGALPCSIIRKAARQGGSKKISGLHYIEGQETLKLSRQIIWRSAVEMSRNTAQLALQVRYLDFNVRWSELVRPEQTPSDGKGPDTEASAFRNALICDKKFLENEIRYCVAFGSQKHLPSRVMKSIAEIEQTRDDGQERYWFSETRIPLYLIKEYEENVKKTKSVDVLSKLQRRLKKRQLKACRKNIFMYLLRKQDIMAESPCSSCHQDVLYRDAVKCSSCQGICHNQCATSSTVYKNEEVEFLITCKQCSETRAIAQVESSNASPTSPLLLLQGQDFPKTAASNKILKVVGPKRSSASGRTREHSSGVKPTHISAPTKKNQHKHWGLIWRKNNEDTGIDFRLKNILHKGNPDMDMMKPICRLCNQPYRSDLMYIRCETCQSWFHAEALELNESKFLSLVGFKCCKCRRIKSPICPYLDPEKKKALERKQAPKMEVFETDFDSSEHHKDEGLGHAPLTREADVIVSLSELEQCTEGKSEVDYGWNDASGPGPRKLQVRRQTKQEQNGNFAYPEHSAPFESNILKSTEKLPVRRHTKKENNLDSYSTINSFHVPSEANVVQDSLSPQIQWVVSEENLDEGMTMDFDTIGFDDLDFEPQTYFSFNELLASDDGGRTVGNEPTGNVTENWENPSVFPEIEISYDQEEPIISLETSDNLIVACKICSHTEPCPDRCCQICGMWIHSHCSPWVESSSWDDGWRCGNCREWR
ncbi:hypothetical protein RD792_003041 [Penstemon davidsonii]|uniref:Uncharacterized protein n=1 Tax=Penstemon davidsonii TaxID=160366 RepID=A0ABR0DSN5_9LAMI|nr:hypothetical protein RD792_003041 [Penstemon davidsonii]